MVPGDDFCPREEVFLWMRQGKCCRLSTQGIPGEDAWCPEAVFVRGRRYFCGCGKGNVAACPRRGCLVRTHGARRRLLSTGGGVFVDAAMTGKSWMALVMFLVRFFAFFKNSNYKKRKMCVCRENYLPN